MGLKSQYLQKLGLGKTRKNNNLKRLSWQSWTKNQLSQQSPRHCYVSWLEPINRIQPHSLQTTNLTICSIKPTTQNNSQCNQYRKERTSRNFEDIHSTLVSIFRGKTTWPPRKRITTPLVVKNLNRLGWNLQKKQGGQCSPEKGPTMLGWLQRRINPGPKNEKHRAASSSCFWLREDITPP